MKPFKVPEIAFRTYQRCIQQKVFRELVCYITSKLGSLRDYQGRVEFIHKEIDQYTRQLLAETPVGELITCKKGCSNCCYTQVSVTEDEANVLLDEIIARDLAVDFSRLVKQVLAGDDHSTFYQLAFEDRRCLFLNEQGECSVYDKRPSVCRRNYVISHKDSCDTRDGEVRSQQIVKMEIPDMLIAVSFLESTITGTMSKMLEYVIKNRQVKRLKKAYIKAKKQNL